MSEKDIQSASEESDAIAVLRELVTLKGMKDRFGVEPFGEHNNAAARADYKRRKPLAWERARHVLDGGKLTRSQSGEHVPEVYVQGSAELSQLVELKKIKRQIEAGTATAEQKSYYENAKESAWRDAEKAIEAIRAFTTERTFGPQKRIHKLGKRAFVPSSSGEPLGYAVVMENGDGPFVGCYRKKEIAEATAKRQPPSHNDVVIPVYAAPRSATRPSQKAVVEHCIAAVREYQQDLARLSKWTEESAANEIAYRLEKLRDSMPHSSDRTGA